MIGKSALSIALVALAVPAMAQGVNPGQAQLAALLGVDAAAYSLSELIQLHTAKVDGDTNAYDFILNHGNAVTRGGSASHIEIAPDLNE